MVTHRVKVATWGMVLVGGLSAFLVVYVAGQKPSAALADTNSSPARVMVTPTHDVERTTPSPTASSALTLHGSVSSVNLASHIFVLDHRGTITTILVIASTHYSGTATSLGQIQPGWHAEVMGKRSGGMVVAITVNATPNFNT
jgi:hypothetical protein